MKSLRWLQLAHMVFRENDASSLGNKTNPVIVVERQWSFSWHHCVESIAPDFRLSLCNGSGDSDCTALHQWHSVVSSPSWDSTVFKSRQHPSTHSMYVYRRIILQPARSISLSLIQHERGHIRYQLWPIIGLLDLEGQWWQLWLLAIGEMNLHTAQTKHRQYVHTANSVLWPVIILIRSHVVLFIQTCMGVSFFMLLSTFYQRSFPNYHRITFFCVKSSNTIGICCVVSRLYVTI